MSATILFLYLMSATVIIISPGPDFIYVITRGIAQGRKAGVYSALGISIGLIVHTGLAAFGLSALLSTSGFAFNIVKFLGAGYLIYLGIKTLLSNNVLRPDSKNVSELKSFTIFRQGVLTNVFNPKAIITFMAFLPQFITPGEGNTSFQIFLLGGLLAFLAMIWFGIVGYFAGYFGLWLSGKENFRMIIKWISGTVLLGLGIRLAVAKR